MNIPSIRLPDNAIAFDDPCSYAQMRLQHVLRQQVPLLADGGREVLWWCSWCQKPWYQAGRQSFSCLDASQIAHLAARLRADVGVVSCLPEAICPICSIAEYEGVSSVEILAHGGFRLGWEDVPSQIMLLCALAPVFPKPVRPFADPIETLLCGQGDIPWTLKLLRETLRWLEHLPEPRRNPLFSFETSQCTMLARRLPPPRGQSWSGSFWRIKRSPLGSVWMVMAVTGQPGQWDADLLRGWWRQLASYLLEVL